MDFNAVGFMAYSLDFAKKQHQHKNVDSNHIDNFELIEIIQNDQKSSAGDEDLELCCYSILIQQRDMWKHCLRVDSDTIWHIAI